MMVRSETTNRADGRAHDGTGLTVPRILTIGSRPYVQCVFQNAWHRAIVFRGHEEQRIGRFDTLPKFRERRRRIFVTVLIVVRQLPDFDDFKFQASGRELGKCVSDQAIERSLSQTADDDGDVVSTFHLVFGFCPAGRLAPRDGMTRSV